MNTYLYNYATIHIFEKTEAKYSNIIEYKCIPSAKELHNEILCIINNKHNQVKINNADYYFENECMFHYRIRIISIQRIKV